VSGAPSFSLFYSAIYAPGLKLQLCVIRVSKRLGEKSSPNADSFVRKTHSTRIPLDTLLSRSVTADPVIDVIERDILEGTNVTAVGLAT
jgi:hypothetical protein